MLQENTGQQSKGQIDVGSAPYKAYEVCSDGFVSGHPGR